MAQHDFARVVALRPSLAGLGARTDNPGAQVADQGATTRGVPPHSRACRRGPTCERAGCTPSLLPTPPEHVAALRRHRARMHGACAGAEHQVGGAVQLRVGHQAPRRGAQAGADGRHAPGRQAGGGEAAAGAQARAQLHASPGQGAASRTGESRVSHLRSAPTLVAMTVLRVGRALQEMISRVSLLQTERNKLKAALRVRACMRAAGGAPPAAQAADTRGEGRGRRAPRHRRATVLRLRRP